MELVEWVGGWGRITSMVVTDNMPTLSVVICSSDERCYMSTTVHHYNHYFDGTHEMIDTSRLSLNLVINPIETMNAKNGNIAYTQYFGLLE